MSNPDVTRNFAGAVDLSGLVNRAKATAQPTPPGESGSFVRDITEADMGQVMELSNTVPVILEVYGQSVSPQLGSLIEGYQGKLLLVTLNGDMAPQLVQALQIQRLPAVFAFLRGRPGPLFQGPVAPAQVAPVLDEVLKVAAQEGVTGVMPQPESGAEPADSTEAEPPPLSPEHQRAYDALAANDLDGAEAAYREALAKAPADADAKAGLGHVGVLRRIGDQPAESIRRAGADRPTDLNAQLLVADLDVAGGHLEDAFSRLLGMFSALDPDGRETVRARLLEYFDMAGPTHPSVIAARSQLTSLLY